jgi:hypothetical protein
VILRRILGSVVGMVAVFASIICLHYAIQGIDDFRNPAIPLLLAATIQLVLWSMALVALGIGIQLVRFGWNGRSDRSTSRPRPILLGIGCFFPGFVFSLPVTVLWAHHTWPGDAQSVFAAMEVSFYIGVAAAIVACIVLLKKRVPRDTLNPSP